MIGCRSYLVILTLNAGCETHSYLNACVGLTFAARLAGTYAAAAAVIASASTAAVNTTASKLFTPYS
jgi:hypothetical protein